MPGIDPAAVAGGLIAFVLYLVIPALWLLGAAVRAVARRLRFRRQVRRFYRALEAVVTEWSAPPG